jgi:putative Ig domain-containing protein
MYILLSKLRAAPVVVTVFALALVGCGGGGESTTPNTPGATPGTGSNAAPTIQGAPSSSVLAGQAYSFQPAANDANGDTLTFSAANLPAWLSINASTGRVSGTPTAADVATYAGITVTVSDGKANASLPPFTLTVSAAASGAATLTWMPPTTNSDGTALTDLAGYEVRYGRAEGDLTQSVNLDNSSLNSYVVENLTAGTWYFAVLAVNSAGATSPLSNVASKTIS